MIESYISPKEEMLCRIIISWSMSKRLDSFIISDLLPNVSSFIYPDSSSLYCRLIRIQHICILLSRQYPSQVACLRHNMHISWLLSVIKMKYYFFLWSSWLLKVCASSSFFFYCYFGGDAVYRGCCFQLCLLAFV